MKVKPYVAEDSTGVRDLILSILKKEYPFDQSAYRDTDINDISGTYSGLTDRRYPGAILAASGTKRGQH